MDTPTGRLNPAQSTMLLNPRRKGIKTPPAATRTLPRQAHRLAADRTEPGTARGLGCYAQPGGRWPESLLVNHSGLVEPGG